MRQETIDIYKYDELKDEAKDKAVEQLSDIIVNYDWWQFTYEDAANIGFKITEFNLDRGAYVKAEFIDEPEDVADAIIRDHGKQCETYKTVKRFLADLAEARTAYETAEDYDPDYEEFEDSAKYEELSDDFLHDLCEAYRIILQHEYEYLTSREAIEEAIRANEYEFTVDGKLY